MILNVIDVIIILFLIAGTILGFKKGAIQALATLIGTILIIILSYYLKNPLSVFLYTYLPFFKLNGVLKDITVINILIYEAIAFFIVLGILTALLSIVLKITGIISKIVDYSIILTLPSKIIGALVGFIETYVFIFILLFIFSQFSFSHTILDNSKYADIILTKTPYTTGFKNSYNAFKDISDIGSNLTKSDNKDYEALKTLLKYEIITPENADKLIENGKINIKGAKQLIESYEVEK
jgi:uncharacterized membrane protein required for colicin V production